MLYNCLVSTIRVYWIIIITIIIIVHMCDIRNRWYRNDVPYVSFLLSMLFISSGCRSLAVIFVADNFLVCACVCFLYNSRSHTRYTFALMHCCIYYTIHWSDASSGDVYLPTLSHCCHTLLFCSHIVSPRKNLFFRFFIRFKVYFWRVCVCVWSNNSNPLPPILFFDLIFFIVVSSGRTYCHSFGFGYIL